jgi:methyl coenzyme M reductase gamma subunit
MQLPILIEPTPDGRFRASLGDPFHATAESDDAQHAVQELVQRLEKRLQEGARIAVVSVADGTVQAPAPLFPADDAYKTDWVYRELEESIAENRRLEDSVGQ